MRKRFTFAMLFVIVSATVTYGQEFKNFKVGLGLGYAAAGGSGAKGGVIVYLEPGYRVNDQLLINLRIESAVLTRGSAGSNITEIDIAGIESYTVNSQYYFSDKTFRPYAGLGFGAYALAAISLFGTSSDIVKAETKFGLYPRVGFDLGHFNLSLDYNIIPASKVEGADVKFKNSYMGFRFGFSIGGGKVK